MALFCATAVVFLDADFAAEAFGAAAFGASFDTDFFCFNADATAIAADVLR